MLPVLVPPLAAADTCSVVFAATGAVSNVHVTEDAPAGIVTVGGIEATAAAPDTTDRVMTVSVASARPNETFPVTVAPP